MDMDHLNDTFKKVKGQSLPVPQKPSFNREKQLRQQRARDDAAALSREARGYGSWGFRFTDKDK